MGQITMHQASSHIQHQQARARQLAQCDYGYRHDRNTGWVMLFLAIIFSVPMIVWGCL